MDLEKLAAYNKRNQPEAIARKARITGWVMSTVSVIVLIWGAVKLAGEPARIRSIPDSVSPLESFPNIFEITTSDAALTLTIMGGAFMILCLGVYRILYGRQSKWLVFAAFLVGFAMMIGHSLYINSVREPVFDKLVSVQHQWASYRYGIIYDEVTVQEREGKKNTTIKNQDKVMWEGEVIADVCEDTPTTVRFCEPGTNDELFVVSGY